MKYHLIARPIPIPGESPASVLIRAVDGNGYRNLVMLISAYWKQNMPSWANASLVDPVRYTQIMEAFGILSPNKDQPCFERNGPTNRSARLVCGMEVPETLFREDVRYYCPKCLQKHAYWRKLWTLKMYSVCPEHRVYLLRDCPTCGKTLTINRGKLASCDCGADLKKMPVEPADVSALKWWMDCHKLDRDKARTVDEILMALARIDGGDDTPQAEHRRLCATYDWIKSGKVAPWLSDRVALEARSLHPRIQLLPLLRGSYRESPEMAKAVLRLWQMSAPNEIVSDGDYLLRRDAELALGIEARSFKRFEKLGLLEFPDRRKRQRGRVSLAATNRLLFALQAENGGLCDEEKRRPFSSLASKAAGILSAARESAGYDISIGLKSLRLKKRQDHSPANTCSEIDWIDVHQIAEILCTYPNAIRSLCQKDWFPSARRKSPYKRLMQAGRGEVEEFNRKYIFSGTFAAQIGENKSNLSEKLMALGVKAVAGPSIDGTLTYLFKREEIEKVDLVALRQLKNYQTKAGRKLKPAESVDDQAETDAITAVEAANILGIKAFEVHMLIRRGMLMRIERLDRGVYVSRKMAKNLLSEINSNNIVPVEVAAQRLNLSIKSMKDKWVNTGVLKIHDFVLWRRVERADLEALEKLLVTHMPAKEAGSILSMHRSYLPNLEKRGKIKSMLIGQNRRVRFYARADLEKLAARH